MTRFDSSIPTARGTPFREATKRSPDRMVNLILVLPIVLGIGCVSLIGMSTLQWGIELIKRGRLLGLSVAFTGFVILVALVGLAFWIVKERLIETTEHITGQVPMMPEVMAPPVVTHFELPARAGGLRLGELDYDPQLVIDWCEAAVGGGSLSFEAWIPRFALPDGTKGRERYTAFRDWLVKQRYAVNVGGPVGLRVNWRNPDAVTFVAGFAEVTPGDGVPLLDAIGQGENKPPAHRLAQTSTLENDE